MGAKKELVIVESPSKIAKLKSILKKGLPQRKFRIMASRGHIRVLPKDALGVDIEGGFKPEYRNVRSKAKLIKSLRTAVGEADVVWLATDPDREGEAIAWHLIRATGRKKTIFHRVTFNSITAAAVIPAFESPRTVDSDLVAAQEARVILDRLIGYTVSPVLWRMFPQRKSGAALSAGRVQSVALRMVVQRDREIAEFQSASYWSIHGDFSARGGVFSARLVSWEGSQWSPELLVDSKVVNNIVAQLQEVSFRVQSVISDEKRRRPYAPFTTSTLQQAASSYLKLDPDTTMAIAQQLYELGLITYIRTDSPAVSPEAVTAARQFIASEYGQVYVGESDRGFQSRPGSQEAHECIRPTSISVREVVLSDGDNLSHKRMGDVYDLIWRRFVASQMTPQRFNQNSVYIAGGEAIFLLRARREVFAGWRTIYEHGPDSDDVREVDEHEVVLSEIPDVQDGEAVGMDKIFDEEHHTRSPARYSQASLVRALEGHGIGRPSTYAAIIRSLVDRKYVVVKSRKLLPTEIGIQVVTFLMKQFGLFMSYDFTSGMETGLDEVAEGRRRRDELLKVYWRELEILLSDPNVAGVASTKPKARPSGFNCPVCGREILIRQGRSGEFLGCSGFSDKTNKCRYSRPIDAPVPDLVNEPCPKCGAQLERRQPKSGKYAGQILIGCTAWRARKCDYHRPEGDMSL
ncbi:MAG: type I DNA topoisomerase [Chloroflexota bacterium]